MAALFRSGTIELAQPARAPIAMIETTHRARLGRRLVCMYVMASEPHVDADPERPARREWRDVDVLGDGLGAEIAELGDQALVSGPGNQITAFAADCRRPHSAPEVRDDPEWQIVRQGQLAKFDEGRVLNV